MSHLTSWQDEYLSALQVRDRKERASKAIYDACAYGPHSDTSFQGYYSLNSDTRLADRAAALDALASENPLNERSDATSAQTRQTSGFIVNPSSPSGDALTRARQDLSDAHHVKGMMQSRLDSLSEELQKLKLKTQLDSKRIKDLHVEKTALTTRMKDQDEELKGKAKLLEVRLSPLRGILPMSHISYICRMFTTRISP